ncbi:MAG: helix-turn-helix domain-containing protein [Candidatus Sericytochromatia bacterium]|nr:helix-turn-helix domain-containing protein [Candidatus Sericytochromatia bacterium]
MTTVAQVLRQTRETMGLTLDEVASRTYIKLPYLEALEQDQIDTILAPVFVQGYIRQVARLLGLDGKDLVRRYQLEERAPRVAAPVLRPEPVLVAAGTAGEAVVDVMADGMATTIQPRYEADILVTVSQGEVTTTPQSVAVGRTEGHGEAHDTPVHSSMPVPPSVRSGEPSGRNGHGAPRNVGHEASRLHEAAEVTAARLEAQRILDEARNEAMNLRRSAESYVQQVLAELEADLRSSLGTIRGGRQFLAQKRRRPEA